MSIMKRVGITGSGVAILAVAVLALNIIASRLFFRVDLTEDRVYSLSEGTRKILDKLDRDVTVRLYFSRSIKDLPPIFKTYASRVEEVLQEYATLSHGRIRVEVIDPKPDTEDEETAQRNGINGVPLPKGDQIYFGVAFSSGAREDAIPYLDPRREEFLEYDLSEKLVGLGRKDKAKLAVLSTLDVMGGGGGPFGGGGGEPWALANALERQFELQKLEPGVKEIPPEVKVLLVIHPKDLPVQTLYAIDQFVLYGGRAIVAVDPMSRYDLQTGGAAARASGQMPQAGSSMPKLFEAWGIDSRPGSMVGDLTLATQINAGGPVLSYPFFLSLGEAQFSKESIVSASLRQMMIAEGGALSPRKDSGFKFEPLIRTTKDSGQVESAMAAFMMPQDLMRELKPDNEERTLAALVRGQFKSAFPDGPPAAAKPEGEGQAQQPQPRAHKAAAEAEATVIVIADVDFMVDANAADKFRFGNQTMIRARNDNLSFISNAVDFLGGSDDLIAIRSRGRIARPFTRVAEIQKSAAQRWQKQEEDLTTQLTEMQKRLNELQAQRTDGNRMALTDEQQGEIAKFRKEEVAIRKKRREVRKSLREDIEALGRRLTAANLLIVPLATTAFGFGVFLRRSRRFGKEARHG